MKNIERIVVSIGPDQYLGGGYAGYVLDQIDARTTDLRTGQPMGMPKFNHVTMRLDVEVNRNRFRVERRVSKSQFESDFGLLMRIMTEEIVRAVAKLPDEPEPERTEVPR